MTHRALVTGAGGFVGRILTAYLERQAWEIVGTEVTPPPQARPWFTCDLGNRDELDAVVKQAAPLTHVFHLGAVTFVPDSLRDPSRTFDVNLLGTIHLTQAVRRHVPSARVIYIASAEVYGSPQFLPLTEDHPLHPTNPYAISKAAADLYCGYLHASENVDVIRMRPFNHTGPGQSDAFVLSSFARQIARIEAGQLPPVLRVGNLETARDFSHVNDVVRAYELAALDGQPGTAYNVCSGRATSIREALDRLRRLSTIEVRLEQDAARMRAMDVLETRGSHERLTAHTGWQPEIPFEQILADLLDYWRGQ
jgi:GDP-4-dehydro-6-deoxy-D-mannose reductase